MEIGTSSSPGVYTGHHRPYTANHPQIEYIPMGNRNRVWVVSVYGVDTEEDRGFIDNDKYDKFNK